MTEIRASVDDGKIIYAKLIRDSFGKGYISKNEYEYLNGLLMELTERLEMAYEK